MAKAKQVTFPRRIYVEWEEVESDPYLIASETLDSIDDGVSVAVYELREVQVMHVERHLEGKKGK
jgi:hypothetical protein